MVNRRFENSVRVSETWSRIFDALSADPCRHLLVTLVDADPDESVPLPESAANPSAPPDPEHLRMELKHTHLPKLADHEFIVWADDPFQARRGPRFDEIEAVVDALLSSAEDLPDHLVIGWQRLEEAREFNDRGQVEHSACDERQEGP